MTAAAKRVVTTAEAIAAHVDGVLTGDPQGAVTGVCTIANPQPGKLCFAEDFAAFADAGAALADSIVLGRPEGAEVEAAAYIAVDNPRLAFALAVAKFFYTAPKSQVSGNARVSASAVIGREVSVGEYCVIGEDVRIGDGTQLGHNVVLGPRVSVGARCRIGSNTVIGEVGFGLARDAEGHSVRIPHIGGVEIGDDVEIGALSSIAAGTIEPTRIGDRVKIDDQVFIAHNCRLEEDVIVIACAEISGSVRIGARTWVGPNVSIRDRVSVTADCLLGIGCTVVKSLDQPGVYVGSPAKLMPNRDA